MQPNALNVPILYVDGQNVNREVSMVKEGSKGQKPNIWSATALEDIESPEIFTDAGKMVVAKMQLDALKIKALQSIDMKLAELIDHLKTGGKND
jgi:hypothetical protein